jgi:hypothetical protein
MAFYFLDVICAINIFPGMGLRWHVLELNVHVYFSTLWENRYKKAYVLICDDFLARIYFIIFKKVCPRLSKLARKNNLPDWTLVPRGEEYLSYNFWSYRSSTSTTNLCARLIVPKIIFLSNHLSSF